MRNLTTREREWAANQFGVGVETDQDVIKAESALAMCGTCGSRSHVTGACPHRSGGNNYDHASTPDGV